jgi:hypothetical protein
MTVPFGISKRSFNGFSFLTSSPNDLGSAVLNCII